MQLDILNKTTKIKFNEKAVKSVELYDDTLYIAYETRNGTLEKLMCPDLADVEYFLLNTLKCFHEGELSQDLLTILAKSLEALKYHIDSYSTGYGKMCKLNYARFLIGQSIENIFRIKSSQDSVAVSKMYKVKVNLKKKSVCFISPKKTLPSSDNKINYNDLVSFVNNCFAAFNDENSPLGNELYRTHLNIMKEVQLP